MKKIFLLTFCQLLFVVQLANSSCPTGYACLLKDLKQQETVIQTMHQNAVNDYYKPKVTEPKLKENRDEELQPTYRELLPFVPKYY